ncbi:hypothetical protein EJ06DRAFT_559772 [Trichodelitschia bisporula]|uniref:Inhibitor I9 domain-containing protein n=1 Tax=Trichodelitschia bisporula TaxID=703511 RepID=A0A6G1HKR0_9PEZI|nr:hypothetical protein EJ06DRAFT_559772 [Trichodelitschia bisporula]
MKITSVFVALFALFASAAPVASNKALVKREAAPELEEGYTGAGGTLIVTYDSKLEKVKRKEGYTGAGGALILNYDAALEKREASPEPQK